MTDKETMQRVHEIGYQMLAWFDSLCKRYDIQYWIAYGTLLGAVRHQAFIPWDTDIDVWMTRDNHAKFMQHQDELPKEYELFLPDSYGMDKYYDLVTKINYRYISYVLAPDIDDFYNHTFPRGMHIDIFFLENTYKDLRGKVQIIKTTALYGLMNSHRYSGVRIKDYPVHWKAAQKILNLIGKQIPFEKLMKWHEKVATRYNSVAGADYYYSSNAGLMVGKIFPMQIMTKLQQVSFGSVIEEIPEESDTILTVLYGDWRKLPSEEEQKLPQGVVILPQESGGGIKTDLVKKLPVYTIFVGFNMYSNYVKNTNIEIGRYAA